MPTRWRRPRFRVRCTHRRQAVRLRRRRQFVVRTLMTVLESEIQWFVARDGKQHGPLSDVEMRKLVELGHLRETDLVWKLGFPDWRPVPAVFPMPQQPAAQPLSAAPV